jgi:hypothetical protein
VAARVRLCREPRGKRVGSLTKKKEKTTNETVSHVRSSLDGGSIAPRSFGHLRLSNMSKTWKRRALFSWLFVFSLGVFFEFKPSIDGRERRALRLALNAG